MNKTKRKAPAPELLTRTEVAARLGLTNVRVSQLIALGMPVQGRKIAWRDAEQFYKAHIGRRTDPEREGQRDGGLIALQKRKLAIDCRRREWELEVEQARYAPIADLNAWITDCQTKQRDIFSQIAPLVAPAAASMTDPLAIEQIIQRHIEMALGLMRVYKSLNLEEAKETIKELEQEFGEEIMEVPDDGSEDEKSGLPVEPDGSLPRAYVSTRSSRSKK